ncbi:hypothetical protein B0H63DRAFT_527535 [Podospora didyma]|uniref:Uncharacterized protein n=1 Tax=Podospora didyma TaxID=330526 RepID=A0AAE0KB72_9PEZI|nr:hypothetical protein B0H63DRAFT_527535 [Podospora didyma]
MPPPGIHRGEVSALVRPPTFGDMLAHRTFPIKASSYDACPGEPVVAVQLRPWPRHPSPTNYKPSWVADMLIKSNDVPELLRPGSFWWESLNVAFDEGYAEAMKLDNPQHKPFIDKGFSCVFHVVLREHFAIRAWNMTQRTSGLVTTIMSDIRTDMQSLMVAYLRIYTVSRDMFNDVLLSLLPMQHLREPFGAGKEDQDLTQNDKAMYRFTPPPPKDKDEMINDDGASGVWWPWPWSCEKESKQPAQEDEEEDIYATPPQKFATLARPAPVKATAGKQPAPDEDIYNATPPKKFATLARPAPVKAKESKLPAPVQEKEVYLAVPARRHGTTFAPIEAEGVLAELAATSLEDRPGVNFEEGAVTDFEGVPGVKTKYGPAGWVKVEYGPGAKPGADSRARVKSNDSTGSKTKAKIRSSPGEVNEEDAEYDFLTGLMTRPKMKAPTRRVDKEDEDYDFLTGC